MQNTSAEIAKLDAEIAVMLHGLDALCQSTRCFRDQSAVPFILTPRQTAELVGILAAHPETTETAVPGEFGQSTVITTGAVLNDCGHSWAVSVHHTGTAGSGGVLLSCVGGRLADLLQVLDELVPLEDGEPSEEPGPSGA